MSGFNFGMDDIDEERNGRKAVAVAVAALLVVVLVLGYLLLGPLRHLTGNGGDYSGEGSGSVTVVVNDGDSASVIGQTLAKAGVVKSAKAFTDAAAANSRSRNIGPGSYRLHSKMKASLALALLLKPSTSLVSYRVLIPEGFTAASIVKAITADTPITAAALHTALSSPSSLGLPSWANGKVEGFLFPATYEVQPGETATQLLSAMVTRFDQAAQAVKLQAGANALGMSEYDVVTLASIVQREGRLVADYPKIAGVFINRIHDGMRLDSDATLYYVLPTTTGPLTAKDLALKTPYNTRLYTGLPPTPINSPGQAALEAVLHYTHTKALYFVTIDKAGHTAYARTLAGATRLDARSEANGVK